MGPSLEHPRLYKTHLPVWEHTVSTSFLAHGFGDVISDEAGFFHGINKVSRGPKHSVVGHEVCGSDTRVIVKDVNCGAVSSVSPRRRLGVRKTMPCKTLQNLSTQG